MWVCPKCGRSFKNVDQSHYCGKPPATIEEYIAAQPEEAQDYLRQINAAIKASIPETKETPLRNLPNQLQRERLAVKELDRALAGLVLRSRYHSKTGIWSAIVPLAIR